MCNDLLAPLSLSLSITFLVRLMLIFRIGLATPFRSLLSSVIFLSFVWHRVLEDAVDHPVVVDDVFHLVEFDGMPHFLVKLI